MLEQVNGKDRIWVYSDYTGRRFVGTVIQDKDGVAQISNPILMSEIINPPQIELQVAPLWYNFNEIETVDVRWTHRHPADKKQVEIYNELMIKIRAARSNIELASSIPNNVVNLIKN